MGSKTFAKEQDAANSKQRYDGNAENRARNGELEVSENVNPADRRHCIYCQRKEKRGGREWLRRAAGALEEAIRDDTQQAKTDR